MRSTHITLTVAVTGWSVEELQKAIADLDEIDAPGNGIKPESVQAMDILGALYDGDVGATYEVISEDVHDVQ